jgi:hypothetical protein
MSADDFSRTSRLTAQIKEWFWWAVAVIGLGPFAIVYFCGFFGLPLPGGIFGAWLTGALTFGGAVTTLSLFKSVRIHGLAELGCVIPMGLFTCFVGYVFLKELGLMR